MTERPIVFSGPMVRAVLDGRKTQTRRIVKPQPGPCDHNFWPDRPTSRWVADDDGWHCAVCGNGVSIDQRRPSGVVGVRCPYGVPGDRLWVKETWRPRSALQDWDLDIRYAADGAERTIKDGEFGERDWIMPKAAARGNVSPLYMPRWASRLTLEITDVRVERLQDISEVDAEAEGSRHPALGDRVCVGFASVPRDRCPPQTAFALLWETINGPDSWAANPWVWAVSFRVAS